MIYEVKLSAFAIEDLIELHRWLSVAADPSTASSYIDRIEERITGLQAFPDRGTPRDDLVAGLRTLSFERRIVIAYRVDGGEVTVLRVIDGARDLAGIFN
ncbi:MAG: type II toxin-antitoxin system RelE/ParE family toxin [Sphingomonadales bacterium]|nr:type II toxin-antitoxin system RelE/ParE family toxin [Sphingomonadales bacterium]